MSVRVRAWVVIVVVVLAIAVSWPSNRRAGDRLQYGLPLLGLGCAVLSGGVVEYGVRFAVMEAGVQGSKRLLGDAAVNRRPDGGLEGMPSGHMAPAAFGASALVACLSGAPVAQGVAVVAAGFVGGSRIEAGRHTLWQVLAGALWGWAAQAVSWRGIRRMVRR